MSYDEEPGRCPYCEKKVYSWGLRLHIRSKHGKRVPCVRGCGKKFLTLSDMNQHLINSVKCGSLDYLRGGLNGSKSK